MPTSIAFWLVLSIFGLSGCSMGSGDSVVPPIVTNKVPDATAVGSETCSDCHSSEPDFYRVGHHRSAFFQDETSAGCESCHGNGSVHVDFFYENDEYEEDEPSDLIGIEDLGGFSSGERSALCQQCHQQDFPLWPLSDHAQSGIGCWNCHADDLHSPPPGIDAKPAELNAQSDNDFCVQCHADVDAEFKLQYHHRVPEGQMNCADCHSIHGEAPTNAVLHGDNARCYECHAEFKGPFVFEHLGTEESCDNCHAPHGSPNNKLLIANNNSLCVQCHFQGPTAFFGRVPHAEFLGGGALCYDCHSHVHGSNSNRNLNPRRF
ncbi:MAG: cytochrome c3 family protein [Myxococcota bacterium]